MRNKIITVLNSLKFNPKITEKWISVYGSRRVIKGQVTETYEDFRTKVHKKIDPFMNKGECWYMEIVGFESSATPIMNRVSTKELPKDLQKKFGELVTYKYGCLEGEHDCYVYRISIQNDDGDIYELPWSQVKSRCVKAGIKHVPEIDQFLVTADNCIHVKNEIVKFVEETQCDLIDQSHPLEGVCIRVDNLTNGKMTIYKQKGLIFRILEGIAKSDEMFVDEEESQG
jgi:hypothetical protein